MIVQDENGLLVPSGSVAALAAAMQRLIDDPALRQRLGETAACDAERFTEAQQLPRFAALLDTVIRADGAVRQPRYRRWGSHDHDQGADRH